MVTITAPEATGGAPAREYKSSPAAPQTVSVTPEGVVTAIVSVTGVVDEVRDLLIPGCYADTLTKRKPKVIRGHQWNEAVGRVLSIEEYLPGDPRLPPQTKDGKPWPKEAGALVADLQYNLETEKGRGAFADVKFYSDSSEAEFSIGYQVPPGAAARSRDGVRHVKRLDLFEISDVLFGAAPLSMTLAVKNAAGEAPEEEDDEPAPDDYDPDPDAHNPYQPASDPADLDVEALHAAAAGELDWDEVERAADAHGDSAEDAETADQRAPDPGDQIAEGATDAPAEVSPAAETATITPDQVAEGMALLADPEVKAALDWAQRNSWVSDEVFAPEVKEGGADRNRGNAERLRHYWQHEAGIPWNVPGDFMDCVDKVSKHMSRRHAKGYCALRHHEMTGEWPGPGAHGGKKKNEHKAAEPLQTKLLAWDPQAEVGPHAAHLAAPETKRGIGPELSGSLEDRRERVRAAVTEALRGGEDAEGRYEWDCVTLLGTWPDRVVAQREKYARGDERTEAYQLDYRLLPDGTVVLSEPQPVTLEVTVEPTFDATILNSVMERIEQSAMTVKALSERDTETKEGRVLSRVNLSRLRSAVTALLNVLAAAGVEIDKPSKKQVADEKADGEVGPEPLVTPDTTSELGRETKTLISANELAEGLALIGEAG